MKSKLTNSAQPIALLTFMIMVLLSPISIHAQESRGTITGKVKDASQAVVAGASVKVTNVAMGTTASTTTNEAGLYFVPYLIPGNYRVAVEASGFKKFHRDGIVLRVNDTLEIDIQLEIGAVGETVTVTADAPALETTNGSMGSVVDSKRIAELPIGHGDPYALIGLASGTAFARDQRLDRPFEPTHIVGYTVNGARANRNDITIDGVASTATANPGEVISSFVPPQDIVQEFKVQTATFDAQFGNTEGGVTNLSIKSGTNQFHGSAYYAFFTPGTSANDFYANRTNTPLADFYYRRFGGTFHGPVTVPKLYSGKNKTFFLYGFEGIQEARPRNNGIFNIPTAKMRSGDFSEISQQIYNPFSAVNRGTFVERQPFMCDTAGNPLAPLANGTQPAGMACNKIPTQLINPIARNFVSNFLPLPTSPATTAEGTNNFQQPDLTEPVKYYSNTVRIDHVISDKQRIFGRVSLYTRNSDYNNYYRNLATGTHFAFISRQAAIDDVYTLNATTVLNLRYGYNRFIRLNDTNPDGLGFDITSLGFPASYAGLINSDIKRFPRFDIANYQGTGFAGENRPNDTHNVIAVVNKAQGVHSLKFGMEFRAYRETAQFFGNDQSGRFNFDSTYTRQLSNVTLPGAQLGHSFAAFLLGIPTSGTISQPVDYAETSTAWGLFFQNDWKVNSRLTLNLGLRYEFEGALTERYNKSVRGFDPNAVQPFEGGVRTAYTTPIPEAPTLNVRGGLTFAGVNGEPRGLYETPKKNLMPRIGFAYKLNEKTVMRGGYGIFFGFLGQRRGDVIRDGFSTSAQLNVTTNTGVSFIETLSNPFQSGLAVSRGAADGLQTFLGQGVTYFDRNPLSPYNQRFQLGFQRELPGGFVAEANYVGNRGTHVEVSRNLNSTPTQFLSNDADTVANVARNTYLTGRVTNPFRAFMPATAITDFRSGTIQRERLMRLFPQFDSVNTTTNEGYSWYHSFQFNLEKRFSRGYTLNASYTYSKFMEATDLLNGADLSPAESISASDIPHRFTMSGIYELPFGKGRRYFGTSSSTAGNIMSHIIGGWQISGIYTLQSGAAIGNWGNVLYVGDFQDILLPDDQRSIDRLFRTDGFVALRETLADGTRRVVMRNGLPVFVNYNDPCKNTFNATTCPGTPLTNLSGLWARDATYRPVGNVRTLANRFGFLRAPRTSNFDLGFSKKAKFGETKELSFRADLLNAFNHPLLFGSGGIQLDPASDAFGQVTAGTQANYPRRVQMTVRLEF